MIWWFLYNATMFTSLTYLAIHFDKWWIILFAALFFARYNSQPNEDKKEDNA